jgi:hypothetical protein
MSEPVIYVNGDELLSAQGGNELPLRFSLERSNWYKTPLYTEPPKGAAKYPEAADVCAEAYQVVGSLLDDLGEFDSELGQKILDNLSEHRMVHKDVLPWPSLKPRRRQRSSPARGTK